MGHWGIFAFPLGLLLASVLLVTSAPATLESPGCSNKEQQVTVSHTYKIDVPKSALVQVETDPQSLSDDGTSLLAAGEAGEEQNIIFRHNIRLQTPQKDCDLADSVQDLLARVKKLEEEVAEMKERCGTNRCCQGAALGKEGYYQLFALQTVSVCSVPGAPLVSPGAVRSWCRPLSHFSQDEAIPPLSHFSQDEAVATVYSLIQLWGHLEAQAESSSAGWPLGLMTPERNNPRAV